MTTKVEQILEAKWVDMNCPICNAPFVARDKWGLFCCFADCEWQEPEESNWNDHELYHDDYDGV